MINLYLNKEWLKNWKLEPNKLLAKHSDDWLIQYIEDQPNITECRLIQSPKDIDTKTEEQAVKTRDEIISQSKELLHIYRFYKEFFDTCVQHSTNLLKNDKTGSTLNRGKS